jgi:hypothetical protein
MPSCIHSALLAISLATRSLRMRASSQDAEGAKDTYGLGEGKPIRDELIRWFRRQESYVLDRLRGERHYRDLLPGDVGDVPDVIPNVTGFTRDMTQAFTPVITGIWDESGKNFLAKIDFDPDEWQVSNPNTRQKIHDATFAFCHETNATTSRFLAVAIEQLKQELAVGIVDKGEGPRELTKRVQAIFDQAETWRARRIAVTENSRARHAAEEVSAEQSGVVAGWEWLVSTGACPLCHFIANEVKSVRLGQDFAVVGKSADYSRIRTPPAHPHCTCSMIAVLTPEYGGPADHQWGKTATQPDTTDYEEGGKAYQPGYQGAKT